MTKSECFSCRDWFNEIFGFWESVKNVGDNFDVEPSKDCVYLYSKKNKKKFNAGLFQIKSSDRSTFKLSESRNNGKLHIIHGHGNYSKCYGLVDILSMQSLSKWDGATYLAASNFNCLEFVSSHSTASSGVTSYYADPTQGPYAALACGPAIVYRNYFVKHHGVVGQLDKEIELLEKARIPVRHGYAIIKNDTALSHFKKDPNSEQKSKNLNSIQIQNKALKNLPDSEAQVKSESRKELKSDPNSNSKTTDEMNSQLNEKEQLKKSAARRGITRSKLNKFKPKTNLDGSKSSLNEEPPKPELHKEQRLKSRTNKEHSKTDSGENHDKEVANEKCLQNDSDKEQRLKSSTNKEHSKTDSGENHDKEVANEKCLQNDSDKEQRLKSSTNKEHSKTDSDEVQVEKCREDKRTKHPDSNRNQAGLLSIKSSCEKSLIKNSEQKQSKLPDSAATSMKQGIAAQHAMPSPPDKEQDKPDTSFDPDDPSIWQVGSHRNCEIVMTRGPNRNFKRAPPDRIANHVYAAAFNFASDVIRTPLTKEVSMKLLTGEYRATILTAWENSIIFNKRAGARKLSLTLLGGGVFANPFDLICNAIKENVDLIVESGLDVYITCYNDDVYRNVDYYLGAVVKKTGGKVYDTNNFNECRELLD